MTTYHHHAAVLSRPFSALQGLTLRPSSTASPAPLDPKLAEMAKAYSKLSLKEFTALQRAIFIELGYSTDFYEQALLRSMGGGGGGQVVVAASAAVAAPVAAAAAPKEEAAAPPPVEEKPKEEKTSFDVKLGTFSPDVKVKLIKDLRTVTDMSITDAKSAIEKGGIIAKKLGKADAEKLKAMLEVHKAQVEIV